MGRQTYTWNNVQLSRQQVAQVLWQAGIRNPGAIAQLIPIAMRESGGRAGVHGSDSPQGRVSGDRGLFQINSTHDRNLIAAGIIRSPQDLFDPVTNARAAAYLSNNGDPRRMRQLWGLGQVNGRTTWVGESGSLPAPDWGSFQQAQTSGLFTQPFRPQQGTGTGVDGGTAGYPGALPSGPGGTAPPPTGQNMYDILNAMNLAQGQTDAAYTQAQRDYARRMAQYEQDLLGLNMTALGYDQQALDVEQAYNESLSKLNSGLNKSQIENQMKQWKLLAKNVANLRELSTKGMQDSKQYFEQSQKLDKDILKATKGWLAKQKGFNKEDYALALSAIKNVVTTEAARWGEIKRLTGAERKNAAANFMQTAKEAQFAENMQRRREISDATARGAMTSKGHGQALNEFEGQRALQVSDARNQLNDQLEAIQQGYNSGKISFQDAQRQAADARARANLGYRMQAGELANQSQQANLQYRGSSLDNVNRWRDAYRQYQEQQEGLGMRQSQGWLDYQNTMAGLVNQRGQNAARDAYNSAMYGINKAGLQVTGRRYGINAQQSQAQLGNTQDQLQYQLATSYLNNPIYQMPIQDMYSSWPGSSGGGYSGGGGGSSYNRPRPVPSAGGASRPRSPFDARPV